MVIEFISFDSQEKIDLWPNESWVQIPRIGDYIQSAAVLYRVDGVTWINPLRVQIELEFIQ